ELPTWNIMMRLTLSTLACTICISGPMVAFADSSAIGFVRDQNNHGTGVVAEYHWTGSLAEGDRFTAGWAGSVLADNNHNGFVGFGVSAEYQISGQNFIEVSFMPGCYKEGDVDLGGHMHFRSTLGIGTNITDRAALSFAFSHISNGGLNERNPGMDMFMLRLAHRY
ncbi:MAG: acyloxyacyl hydrolase, partial [Rhodobacteraceae bacterium]|nr:acyloxyacyl hydrolase [Paracoccaceae bacterium]